MTGGRQRQSRKNLLRNISEEGKEIMLIVSRDGECVSGPCHIEQRGSNGYFIRESDAQIYLKSIDGHFIENEKKEIYIDLGKTLQQNLIKYEEALN